MKKSREQTAKERDELYTKYEARKEQAAVGRGMAVAAAIVMQTIGDKMLTNEILASAGYTSVEQMKDDEVNPYDIEALAPLFED